eukprot:480060-Rhodomonas_salina.1
MRGLRPLSVPLEGNPALSIPFLSTDLLVLPRTTIHFLSTDLLVLPRTFIPFLSTDLLVLPCPLHTPDLLVLARTSIPFLSADLLVLARTTIHFLSTDLLSAFAAGVPPSVLRLFYEDPSTESAKCYAAVEWNPASVYPSSVPLTRSTTDSA